jgi:hypothetical protein
MKHVNNFNSWRETSQINEGYEITLQAAIALAIIGFAGLRQIFLNIAKRVGGKQKLEEADLLNLVDEGIDAIRKADKSGASFAQLEKELKARVKSGKIQTINDILKSISELTR